MASFDENGTYNKTVWETGDIITAEKMNNIEDALETINNNDITRYNEADSRLDALDERIDSISTNGGVDLSNYYTKSETYSKDEVDTLVNNSGNSGSSGGETTSVTGVVYVKDFETGVDDTTAINNAFAYARNNHKSYKIVFTNKDYYVSGPISGITGDMVEIDGNNSTIHFTTNALTTHYQFISTQESNPVKTFKLYSMNFDGISYGIHYDSESCLYPIYVYSDFAEISHCRFTNIYGSGINVAGVVDIHDNYFYDCSGSNYQQSNPSGGFDNYGDAIRVFNEQKCKCGRIANNYLEVSSGRKSRAGIVLEYHAQNVSICNNYIKGYNVGIHLEIVEYNEIRNNTIINTHCGIMLSDAPYTIVNGNHVDCTKDDGSYYRNTSMWVYGTAESPNNGCVINGNNFIGNNIATGEAVMITGIQDICFLENFIDGYLHIESSHRLIFANNTLYGTNVPDASKRYIFLYASNDINFNNNHIHAMKFEIQGGGARTTIVENEFYQEGQTDGFVNITNNGFVSINRNHFHVSSNMSYIVSNWGSIAVRGEFNGNIIYANEDITFTLLQYSTDYIVSQQNLQISADFSTVTALDTNAKFEYN